VGRYWWVSPASFQSLPLSLPRRGSTARCPSPRSLPGLEIRPARSL